MAMSDSNGKSFRLIDDGHFVFSYNVTPETIKLR